jgi:ABC-type uncharacterized transport system substrate-binding protein
VAKITRLWSFYFVVLCVCGLITSAYGQTRKIRLFVVSSYHRDYLWSQDTHKGVCAALLEYKFVGTNDQIAAYTHDDYLETDTVVIKKKWLNSKRSSGKNDMVNASVQIAAEIRDFKPDLILLGDDNATNYIGSQFIDSGIPVVFWGVDGTPMKYDLIDSIGHPGHNITGVYQPGFYKESLEYLKQLVPDIKTFAILSDDSETGRTKAKAIEHLGEAGGLPLKLIETVLTNSYSEWQSAALRLQHNVDAFFVLNHDALKDDLGNRIDQFIAVAWYLRNVKKPECAPGKQFVQEGILLTADDSGYKQGYEAVKIAHLILHDKRDPAGIPVIAPDRGSIIVNRQRARMLEIDLTGKDFIEEFADTALASDP